MTQPTPRRTPVDRALARLAEEYEDHLSTADRLIIVQVVISALREPNQQALEFFEEELTGLYGVHSDPAAEADSEARRATERRRAFTYAWRRAFDALLAEVWARPGNVLGRRPARVRPPLPPA
jgi:hypothetical protein